MSSLNNNSDNYSENYGSSAQNSFRLFPSPYLNYDPRYIPQTQPEYIYVDGNDKRGRFELAFGQIGTSCILGATIGGATGLYNGLKATTLAGQAGKLRRTQILNHVMKKGSATANTLGSIAVIYVGFGVLISSIRGSDDDINTIAAATATGCLYKSTAGLRRCGLGGAIGLGISALYALWNSRDSWSNLRLNPAQR